MRKCRELFSLFALFQMEANNLTTEAVEKKLLMQNINRELKERIIVLESEIKRSKTGHSNARRNEKMMEMKLNTQNEEIHEQNEMISELNHSIEKITEKHIIEKKKYLNDISEFNILIEKNKIICENLFIQIGNFEKDQIVEKKKTSDMIDLKDILEGERNSYKNIIIDLKKDMNKIHQLLKKNNNKNIKNIKHTKNTKNIKNTKKGKKGKKGIILEEVENMIYENRDLQVLVKIHQAERDGAVDDLREYKDALMKSMISNTKKEPFNIKKTIAQKIKKNVMKMNKKRTSSSTTKTNSHLKKEEEHDLEPKRMSLVELQNLCFVLMDKVEERDERINYKEMEKRELFGRIEILQNTIHNLTLDDGKDVLLLELEEESNGSSSSEGEKKSASNT